MPIVAETSHYRHMVNMTYPVGIADVRHHGDNRHREYYRARECHRDRWTR